MSSMEISSVPTTIDALPNETLQSIFQNLEFRYRKNASRVCRRWNEIVMDTNNIVLHVRLYDTSNFIIINEILACKRPYKYLRMSYNILPPRVLNKFSNCVEAVKICSIDEYMPSKEPNFLDQLYRLKKLKRLHLNWTFVPDDLKPTKQVCNNLRELFAYEVTFARFVSFTEFISSAFPRLTKLVLNECDFEEPFHFSNLPTLEQLVFECGTAFDCSVLKDFGSLPSLRQFKLRCCKLDGIDQIERDFKLPHITELDFTVRVYDCHLVRLTEIFPALTSLNVAAREKYLTVDIEGKAAEKIPRNCQLQLHKFPNTIMGGDPDDCSEQGFVVSDYSSGMITFSGTL